MQLFNGDCLEVMKSIPDKSVDCIITDPPYKVTARGNSGTMGGGIGKQILQKKVIFLSLMIFLVKIIYQSFIEY